jgi:hypothetical protein
MRGGICFASFIMLCSVAHATTDCIDPSLLARSTVSSTRYLDDQERDARSDVIGIQGTGWFQSTNTVVTVEHVALAMGLSTEVWKPLTIQNNYENLSISVRIRQVIGGAREKLVLLELQSPVPSATTVIFRSSPLEADERLTAIAYPHSGLKPVSGRFVRYATDAPLAGAALLEMYDGDDRLTIDHGASGAPVFDCEGRVAAVISTIMTQTMSLPFGVLRVSTPWGTPNVSSVPITLTDVSQLLDNGATERSLHATAPGPLNPDRAHSR